MNDWVIHSIALMHTHQCSHIRGLISQTFNVVVIRCWSGGVFRETRRADAYTVKTGTVYSDRNFGRLLSLCHYYHYYQRTIMIWCIRLSSHYHRCDSVITIIITVVIIVVIVISSTYTVWSYRTGSLLMSPFSKFRLQHLHGCGEMKTARPPSLGPPTTTSDAKSVMIIAVQTGIMHGNCHRAPTSHVQSVYVQSESWEATSGPFAFCDRFRSQIAPHPTPNRPPHPLHHLLPHPSPISTTAPDSS